MILHCQVYNTPSKTAKIKVKKSKKASFLLFLLLVFFN